MTHEGLKVGLIITGILASFVALVVLLLVWTNPRDSVKEEAEKKAENVLKAVTGPPGQNQQRLGLTVLRVFGRDKADMGMMAGGTTVECRPSHYPRDCTVTIPFWCTAADTGGSILRRREKLTVRLSKVGTSGLLAVADYRLQDEGELTYFRQLLGCLMWVMGIEGFLILFLRLKDASILLPGYDIYRLGELIPERFAPIGMFLLAACAVSWAFYVPYAYFDSAAVGIVFVVILVIVTVFLWRRLASWLF